MSTPHQQVAPRSAHIGDAPTFQSFVQERIQDEKDVIKDILGGALHQLQGADDGYVGSEDGYVDGESVSARVGDEEDAVADLMEDALHRVQGDAGADGFINTQSDVGIDISNDINEAGYHNATSDIGADRSRKGAMAGILAELDKGADPTYIVLETSDDGSGDDGSGGGGGDSGGGSSGGGSGSGSSADSGSKSKGKGAAHHSGGKHKPVHKPTHHAEGDDVGYVAPAGTGISLQDVLNTVDDTANAVTAVALAPKLTLKPVPGYPEPPGHTPPVIVDDDGNERPHGIHGHRFGAFAHEKPALFLLILGIAAYFIFFRENSVFETVLLTGNKSRKHDKVETITEEIHTRRESVLGKPTFPDQKKSE